ncbi:glycosyltransferase [Yinghuangia seranimata]|uniref:glycosyltransferase n=1 Tax=Yinghuangia seranimata TaxID=408067 RepID=UPI003CCFA0E2
MPSVGAYLQPLHPTRVFAPPVVSARSFGPAVNLMAGHAVDRAVDRIFTDAARDLRTRLGLPPVGLAASRRERERRHWPVRYGFSPTIVPRPRDWRPGLDPVGYWWTYDQRRLPDEVEDFLASGPAPAFVGLGSATVPDAARVSAEVVAALRAAGLRGVIQQGWAGLAADGDDMLTVDDVPHHLLFPRTAAVVHHCGAGTTAAGLRAGVPAVPVPIQFDAGFWARRLVRLGIAPCTVPLRTLTADALAPALAEATRNPSHVARARAVAARLAAEDAITPVDSTIRRVAGLPETRRPSSR